MFITFVPEEQSCSVITGTCLQNPGTENGTTTFTLLGYLEILYAISIEKIPNDHFSLGLTVVSDLSGRLMSTRTSKKEDS